MTETIPDTPGSPAAPAEYRGRPVFILAPARSFSTVVTALLGGHPDIYAFPEMQVFSAATVGDFLDKARREPNAKPAYIHVRLSGVYRAVAQVHERDQSDEAVARAISWLRQRSSWPMTQLMNHLLKLVAPRTGLEKSPETIATDESLAACMKAYPLARYIHLTRHPVNTQRSMQQNHQPSLIKPLTEKALVAVAASAWYQGHRRVLRTLTGLPPGRWIRVRGEDVLYEPRTWLPRILGWLGLACDDEIIEGMLHTERWEFGGTGPSSRLFGGDPKFFLSPTLRPVVASGPVSFDPSWGLPAEMRRRMTALAHDLGY